MSRGEAQDTVAHVLVNIPLGLTIGVDTDGSVGDTYDQGQVGLPFGEQYLVGADGQIEAIFAGYDPQGVAAALEADP